MGSSNCKVYNAIGTTGYKPKGGKSWIAKYREVTESNGKHCANVECRSKKFMCGAHLVCNSDERDDYDRTFIAPLCKTCNHHSKTGFIEIDDRTEVMFVTSYYVVEIRNIR